MTDCGVRRPRRRWFLLSGGMAAALHIAPLLAQQQQPAPQEPPHGIDMVDTAPIGGAIATPLPEAQRRKLKKLDIPELSGARQALGSQLIDGALPRPVIDYVSTDGKIRERISFF